MGHHKRALEADLEDPDRLANYAQLLFGIGRTEEGLELLLQASGGKRPISDALRVEILVYRYAHQSDSRDETLKELKRVFSRGARTPTWTFEINLNQAKKESHPNMALLTDIAAVATGRADIDILSKHADWRNA